jgi:CRISPR/Cas system endoribonuclease Cas6 (RAMP superfamily)
LPHSPSPSSMIRSGARLWYACNDMEYVPLLLTVFCLYSIAIKTIEYNNYVVFVVCIKVYFLT